MLRKLRTGAKWIEWTCLALIPVLAVLQRIGHESLSPGLARELMAIINAHPILPVFVLALGGLAGKATQSALDRWVSDRKTVKAVLDAAHTVYFQGVAEHERYLHRVTLFRARRHWRDFPLLNFWNYRVLWKPALRMQSRSGTAYQRSAPRLAIDDEDEDGNDGVAGRAWFANAEWTVVDLPEWPVPEPPDPLNDARCLAYSTQGCMRVHTCATIKVKSRSVTASVVRKAGERWGVVVFDSRDPRGVSDAPPKKAVVQLTAFLLSQIV
jgi:hypothetical protein